MRFYTTGDSDIVEWLSVCKGSKLIHIRNFDNRTAREVEINLSKDDRVIEITDTQMRQWDIVTVIEEATEITSLSSSLNSTDMGENVRNNNNASLAGDILLKLMNQLLIIQKKKQHRYL